MKYLAIFCALVACGENQNSGSLAPDGGAGAVFDGSLGYSPCPREQYIGGFSVTLYDDYTAAQGQVADGVVPSDIPRTVATAGACALLQPRTLLCNPACPNGQTCGDDGVCVAYPSNIGVGTVSISGLSAPVSMTANAPVYYYTFRGNLPHPGFEPGARIQLDAADFALRGQGIDPLTLTSTAVRLVRGQGAAARWKPPETQVPAQITLSLNIANHGGNPGQIDCVVPDTGSYDIPVNLVDALLDLGASGFPTLQVVRRTVDSVQLAQGCVEFSIQDSAVADIEIPGLISCSSDDECPPGQVCQVDLTCQ